MGNQLRATRRRLLDEILARPDGLAWCERWTDACDEAIRALVADPDPPFTIVATGGYGRRELNPCSDLDLTVVPRDESAAETDDAIRRFFRALQETFVTGLRIEIGYAYRLLADAPGLDVKTRTGLLDMRLVHGDRTMYAALERALDDTFLAGEFLLAKIEERDRAMAKHGDTPLLVEPHLKEGAGGLRCFHTANWIRRSIGERSIRTSGDYETILTVRNLLHAVSGKPQDLLTRSRRSQLQDHYGRDVAEGLTAAMSAVHSECRKAVDRIADARFPLAPGVLALRGEVRFDGTLDPGVAAVGVSVGSRLGLEIPDLRAAVGPLRNGAAAVFALASGEPTLRNLDRGGILALLLPELDACRYLLPGDTVHTFSVFEHTMRVVRNLDRMASGTFLGDVRDSVTDLEVLYLAALLHDVGKADPTRDHSEHGATLADAACRRWEVADDVRRKVVWLVREHLTMSRFIRIRDLTQPSTVDEFAAIVEDHDRLAMLTLLTAADVGALSEGAWTPTQEAFQKGLYHATAARLQNGEAPPADPNQIRRRLIRRLSAEPSEEEDVRRFVDTLPAHYLAGTPTETVRLHRHYASLAVAGTPTVDFHAQPEISASQVTVCCPDKPALLSEILGVFYAHDLSVVGIRAATSQSEPPVALDVFTLAFGGRPVPAATATECQRALLDVIAGRRTSREVMEATGKDPDRAQNLFRWSFVPGSPGVLELRAPRGRGMAYRLSREIAERGWNVVAARVGQWAGNAAAAFYLTGRNGEELTEAEVAAAFDPSARDGAN